MVKIRLSHRCLLWAAVLATGTATAAAAAVQERSGCAAIAAQLDQVNAEITSHTDALDGSMSTVMAAQTAQRRALEKQRAEAATRALAGGLVGAILPGADTVAGIAGAASAGPTPATAPSSNAELSAALAATAGLGRLAVRAGDLMTAYQTLQCSAK